MGRMAEMQRKLLEQMMGPEAMGVVQIALDWWDPKVCRNYMCGVCPHDIFGNTKMDLGPCPKLHNEKVILAYNAARLSSPQDPRFAAFDQEYQNNIYAFVEDCDRKIRMSQRRLEKTPEENKRTVDLMKEIGEIELSIQGETEEIEQLGEAGKVEESMAKLEAVEALKSEKEDKEKELQRLTDTGGASGHQKLRVCETCGAYLSVLDSDRRLADHFGGKMHLGYHELRKLLEKFTEQRMAARLGGGGGNAPQPNQGQGYASRPGGGAITGTNNIPVGGGMGGGINTPRGPAPSGQNQNQPAPYAPRGPGLVPPPSNNSAPHTPHGPGANDTYSAIKTGLGNEDEEGSIVPGHGEKRRREVGELMDDVGRERERSKDRERERRREDRYRDERREDRERSSKYEDRERRHRSDRDRTDRSDRDREPREHRSDRDRSDRERESREHRSERDRSDRPEGKEKEKEKEKEHRSSSGRQAERKEYKEEDGVGSEGGGGDRERERERERERRRSKSPSRR